MVVSQQDEKSQIKNRAKAMKVLRSRLYEMELRKQQEAIAKDRRSQVGTGERSEKIRTYHFKENRITDHRVNFTTLPAHRRPQRRSRRAARQRHHPFPVGEAQGRHRRVVTTINARIAEGRYRLLGAGIEHNEAALFSASPSPGRAGVERDTNLTSGDELEPPAFAAQFGDLISRRAHREPLAYITGTREFWNLTFEVSPAY